MKPNSAWHLLAFYRTEKANFASKGWWKLFSKILTVMLTLLQMNAHIFRLSDGVRHYKGNAQLKKKPKDTVSIQQLSFNCISLKFIRILFILYGVHTKLLSQYQSISSTSWDNSRCWGEFLDDKINTILISVWQIWSYRQQLVILGDKISLLLPPKLTYYYSISQASCFSPFSVLLYWAKLTGC